MWYEVFIKLINRVIFAQMSLINYLNRLMFVCLTEQRIGFR